VVLKMDVLRTEQIVFKPSENDNINILCQESKKLWNSANYMLRQDFFKSIRTKTGPTLTSYRNLYQQMNGSTHFINLPKKSARYILKQLSAEWREFFDNKCDQRIPKYKRSNEYMIVFSSKQCKIRNGVLKLPKLVGAAKIRTRLKSSTGIDHVEISTLGDKRICKIVYRVRINKMDIGGNKVIGIDPGERNLITVANNFGAIPLIVKGGVIKSINQYYMMKKNELKKIYRATKVQNGARMQKLKKKYHAKIADYLHKLSRRIVDYCRQNNVKTIVVGYNGEWVQKKRKMQYDTLVSMLKYKAENVNMNMVIQEESYTSKCSFLDFELIGHHKEYCGKRVSRGIFTSSNGTIINADVNAALNIIRKAVPNAFATDGIEGVGLHPKRVTIS
jgi:putative transposase